MPRVSTELNAQYWEPVATGPVAQADLTASVSAPASIAASGNFTTGVLGADGFKAIAVGATLNQAGSLSVQRYIDAAGQVQQGAASTATLTANNPGVVNITDGLPFQSFKVTITNSAGSVATLSNFALLLNAA